MNPFEMVVLIVLITAIASVLRARFGIRRDNKGNEYSIKDDSAEAARLRDEVKALKDRVIVLERIATDKNHLLDQEIERLRDR
jgi:hypothetical protein